MLSLEDNSLFVGIVGFLPYEFQGNPLNSHVLISKMTTAPLLKDYA
jgi:hypothetical protein